MTLERLRDFYQAQPFLPFVLHLADGREIPVHHRDFIMSSPSGRTVIVSQPDDTLNVIDLLLVTDIEVRPNKNGKAAPCLKAINVRHLAIGDIHVLALNSAPPCAYNCKLAWWNGSFD